MIGAAAGAALVTGVVATTVVLGGSDSSLPVGMLVEQFPTVPTTAWVVQPQDLGGTTFMTPQVPIGGDLSTGYIDGGEVMIVGVGGTPSGPEVVAVDRADGRIRWRHDLGLGCSEVLFGDRIACVEGVPGDKRVTFLDIDDGTVLSETAPDVYTRVDQAGRTLVYSGVDDRERLHIAGGSSERADEYWTVEPQPFGGTRFFTESDGTTAAVQDYSSSGGTTFVVREDGTFVTDGVKGYSTFAPDGSALIISGSPAGTRVVPVDGRAEFDIPGIVSLPTLMVPGSSRSVLVAGSDGYDATTGEYLWTSAALDETTTIAAVVANVAMANTADGSIALDTRDGVELWESDLSIDSYRSSTDGRRLFQQGPRGLTALDIATGDIVWENLEGAPPREPTTDDAVAPDYEISAVGLTDTLVYSTSTYIKGYRSTGQASETPGDIEFDRAAAPVGPSAPECPVVTTSVVDVGVNPVTLVTTRQCRQRRRSTRKGNPL